MSESIIWDTLIQAQDDILGIFNEYAEEIEEKGLKLIELQRSSK